MPKTNDIRIILQIIYFGKDKEAVKTGLDASSH